MVKLFVGETIKDSFCNGFFGGSNYDLNGAEITKINQYNNGIVIEVIKSNGKYDYGYFGDNWNDWECVYKHLSKWVDGKYGVTKILALNKIYQMDCIEGMKRIPDKSIDLILTDIPYGEVSKNGEERAKYKGQLRKIDKENADILTFDLDEFLNECSRVANGGIYIFCGIEQVSYIYSYFNKHTDFMVRQCAWKKTNPSPVNGQHMWLSSMENCIFAKRRKTKFYAHCKSAVWDYPVGRSKIHPTQKPVELFKYLVQASSDEGDTVLDPCIGSGTTAVACQELNRNWIGFEVDGRYIEKSNEVISKNRIY
ncbi:site-specific DNA-methyltransferase [Caldifermentibacillus hisashii]|uniref:Methyltransferase n=1 Tax=Caldifermentibacillus hisashii TaxID=996558 RepID=A0ABU9K2X6_9BACI